MANVKVPALLHKMSKTVQKAWYKKNNMEMPNEPAERSAAVAKRVKVAPRKASDVKPDSVRAINTARMAAYMAKGGRAPIGAAGSGGNSVMAGSNMSTVRGMITGIKAGFNPKVSLDPYESERAKKTGPRSLKLKKEEVEQVDEGAKEDAEKLLGGPVKTKPKMPPGKQPAGYRYVRALARRAMKAGLKKEEVEQVDEISPGLARKAAAASQVKAIEFSDYSGLSNLHNKEGKKEANRLNRKSDKAMDYIGKRQGQKGVDKVNRMVTRVVGEEVEQVAEIDYKKYLKVSQEKRPFTIRTVDAALKTDKAGDPNPLRKLGNTNKARKFAQKQLTKKFNASQPAQPFPVYEPGRTYVGDSVEHDGPVIDEARRMSAAEKLGRAFDSEQQRSALSRQRGLDLLKQKDTEKTQNKLASGDMTKLKKEEIEESTMKYIEEKLTAADPASKYIKDFVASENPKFAGKSKKERISMALGAYYAKKRGTNEEVELDESHGAEKLGDMLESDADHETKMKRIKIAPTAHLKYLHKYNMGYSGGGDHPMTKHIKDELKNREMKKEEVVLEEPKDAADVGEYDYEGDMAKSQLRSIMANSKRMHDMLEDTTNLPEWVQSKITLAEDYVVTAANYMESEMNEAVERVDELKKSTLQSYAKKASKEMKKAHDYHQMRYGGRDGSDSEYMKKTYPAAVAKYDRRDAGVAKAKQKLAKEEVEQTDEAVRGYIQKGGDNAYLGAQVRRPANQAERDKLAQDIAANRKYNAGKNIGRKSGNVRANAAGMTQSQKNAVTAFSTASNKELGPKRYSYESAEGKVAVTPKEKSLAAHHGDKTKITYGDVIKARLKSAAAKKMGK